jgi:hypothetical protein
MKRGILFLLLFCSVFSNAQSLKEALYGGKLKNQPGTVIRKGDDLSTKMDTVRKAPVSDSAVAKMPGAVLNDSAKTGVLQNASAAIAGIQDSSALADTAAVVDATSIAKENAAATKDNNSLLKEYIDSVTTTLKAEVLTSKKIKRGEYYVTVSYAINTDGQLAINNVSITPENGYLQEQIKERLLLDAPRMNPVLSSSGAPRRVSKNYNFTLSKE